FQQAQQFIDQGFVLGFGGAMTFERALQIRRLATRLPLDAMVLETDSPDIPPAWLDQPGKPTPRNEPARLPRIGRELAALRSVPYEEVVVRTGANARRVLPRLRTSQAPLQSSSTATTKKRPEVRLLWAVLIRSNKIYKKQEACYVNRQPGAS